MDRIDVLEVERFFATVGAKIYDVAERTVREEKMQKFIESGVVVGLSGGADSVMLLCFLLEYRRRNSLDFSIVCSHVNHGIRGDEADADEAFCKQLCDDLGVEIIVDRFSIPEIARHSGLSIEESARATRYSVFQSIIQGRNNIGCVAVAHNMSDSVETVIFNILRGSGARGASGIRPIRDEIVRPLINISKHDIASAADEFGIPYVTDSTNLSSDYTRNYIRNEIIPSFERITADPERMIARFADNMRSDDNFINSYVDEFLMGREVIKNQELISLHYSVYARVIAKLAERVGASISYKITADIHSLLQKDTFSYSLIGGATFVCERGECRVLHDMGEGIDYCFSVGEGLTDLSPLNAVIAISKNKETYLNVYKKSIQVNLSSAIINGSLYLRPKKDGDTVYYGGMTHKIKKLFSDAKIPRLKRKLIPILCDDSGVVWIPGFGVRDDGIPKDQREDLYVLLAVDTKENSDSEVRLYSGSEFRT